jgi:ribose/xylose/arabinose/galactoside ABC-type transport system permease subunit
MLTITQAGEQSTSPTKKVELIAILEKFGVFLFLLLLTAFFQLQNERFLSIRNILNILSDVSIYGILSVGMTFVILTSGIDLSIGSLLAFGSMCGAVAVKSWPGLSATGFSWLVALGISLIVGSAAGYLQGKAITRLRVPAFIVTLGGMTLWRGATLMLSNGSPAPFVECERSGNRAVSIIGSSARTTDPFARVLEERIFSHLCHRSRCRNGGRSHCRERGKTAIWHLGSGTPIQGT